MNTATAVKPETTERVSGGTGPSIDVVGAAKTIDGIPVLHDVSFSARPGQITAMLGPNGAGKSTVLRGIVGLARLDAGTVRVGGRALADWERPLLTAGVLLDPDAAEPRRSARDHLRILAAANGLPKSAVERALRLVGVAELADRRVAQMSLGTRQRLALAGAFVGEPQVLILDEPHNGLDASAIRWLRNTLRAYAAAGRTVLLSSHLLGEVARLADRIVVIDDGRVVADTTVDGFIGDEAADPAAALEDRYLALVGDR